MMTAFDEEKIDCNADISTPNKEVPVRMRSPRSNSYEGILLSNYSFGGLDQLCRLEEQVEMIQGDVEAIKKRKLILTLT